MTISNRLPTSILLRSLEERRKRQEEDLKEPVPKDIFDHIIKSDNRKSAVKLEMCEEYGHYEIVHDEHCPYPRDYKFDEYA